MGLTSGSCEYRYKHLPEKREEEERDEDQEKKVTIMLLLLMLLLLLMIIMRTIMVMVIMLMVRVRVMMILVMMKMRMSTIMRISIMIKGRILDSDINRPIESFEQKENYRKRVKKFSSHILQLPKLTMTSQYSYTNTPNYDVKSSAFKQTDRESITTGQNCCH